MTMNVGVIGASGYSGEELVKLLAGHPQVNLSCVTSRRLAGEPVIKHLPALRGVLPPDFCFTASTPEDLTTDASVALYFLALPHGTAAEYALPLVEAGKRVIDLSADFRLNTAETYQDYYNHPHPSPTWLAKAPYVLPEWTTGDWMDAKLIACPGCYPTSILLPLLPLLRDRIIDPRGIVINAYSGVSGAGKKAEEAYLFCECAENTRAYGIPRHRHLSEIEEQLALAANTPVVVQFNPHLAPMRRGIATTITARSLHPDVAPLYAAWDKAYHKRPFVHCLPSGLPPQTRHVVGTNRIEMSAVYDNRTGNTIITSAEDNLLKGASGQAVQIMNLWHGWPETEGLPC
jgi:N-acetyl-gamma-glutamyl-phosphate reductase